MKKRKLGTALTALALAAVVALGMIPTEADAASSSEIKKQIEDLKNQSAELEEQQAALQEQYQANENEMLDLVSQKSVIDQEINLLNSQISNINDQVAAYNLLIADKQDELDEAQSHLAELNEKNKERIRAMEEEGNVSYWKVLFNANSFSDLLDRINMIEEIAASDQRRLKEMSEAAELVAQVQETLESEKTELEQTKAELDETQAELEVKRQEADELLTQLIAKGEEYEALMDEAEQAEQDLMLEIAAKEKEYENAKYREWLATSVVTTTTAAPTASSGGSGGSGGSSGSSAPSSSGWTSPLKASYKLTSPFGMRVHPVLGYERMHYGVDMACASGTPVYAAKSGTVSYAGWGSEAGNYVTINHGDGFASVYMHLTSYVVSSGTIVSAGQLIGYVGSTGLSTGPHLHFGISYNGTYVNPMNYI